MHDVALYLGLLTSILGAIVSLVTTFIVNRSYKKMSRQILTKEGFLKQGADAEELGDRPASPAGDKR